jgi:hypothetical protein
MAPGFFAKLWDKVKDVGRKVWNGIKKVVPVVKKVWDSTKTILKPIITGGAAMMGVPPQATNAALSIGEGVLDSADSFVSGKSAVGEAGDKFKGLAGPFRLMKSKFGS